MLARRLIADVGDGDLAQGGGEAERARTRERRHGIGGHLDGATTAILTARAGPCMTRIGPLAVLAHVSHTAAAEGFAS